MKRFARIAAIGFASLALPLAAQAQSTGFSGGGSSDSGKSGGSISDLPHDQATSGNSSQDQIDPNQDKSVKARASDADPSVLPPGSVSEDVRPAPRFDTTTNSKTDSVGLPKAGVHRHVYGRRTGTTTRRASPPSTPLDTGSGNDDSGNMNNMGDFNTGTMDHPGSNLNGVDPTQPNDTHGNSNDQGSLERRP